MDTTVSGTQPGIPPSHRGAFAPGQQFGPWVIERELARGGQGAILVARHVQLGHRAALKLLLHGDERSRARFLREAKVLARLKHPNVPTIHDMGEHMGATFLAMELIEGQDLHARLKARGVPDCAWTARVMAQVARIVQACHDQGILHRDLKPHNVLIEDGTERPVLVDFGLLKKDDSVENGLSVSGGSLSLAGEMAGTPSYMAPEQADSSLGEPGRWTDVYALGATLFHLLTGAPPYEGTTNYNVITKLLAAKRAPDASKSNPEVPASLSALCVEAMAPEPGDRLDSALEFAERLDEAADVLEGKALPARRGLSRRAGLVASAVFALAGAGAALAILLSAGPPPVGTLVVRSDYAAELWEGDQLLAQLEPHGQTEVGLPAGPHALTTKVGAQARPLAVDVPAQGRTEHVVSFTSNLAIGKPDGATVSLRDASGAAAVDVRGEPATELAGAVLLRLLQGEYDLELRLDGHHPRVTRVALGAEPLEVTLEPGRDEALFVGPARGVGYRIPPHVLADVDGDGWRDLVGPVSPDGGNDSELVAYSGRSGELLWTYPPGPLPERGAFPYPINLWGGVALQVEGEHAPALVVGAIQDDLPVALCLDPRDGSPKVAIPLDGRSPYRRPPLAPIPLDPEGTGAQGYAIPLDNTARLRAFVGLCLRGGSDLVQEYDIPLYGEYLTLPPDDDPDDRFKPRNDYGLFVTPLHRDGQAYGVLWYWAGKTLALAVPGGTPLGEVSPSRKPLFRGAIRPPPPTAEGVLAGWSLRAKDGQEAVELVRLDPASLRERWRHVAHGTRAGGGRSWIRARLAEGEDPRLVLATSRAGLLVLDEETGDELARVDLGGGPLADPLAFRAGDRRLLAVCRDARDGLTPTALILDPARDFAVVWERTLDHGDVYRFLSAADLDGDGHDELITAQEGNRLLVLSPAISD